ncbi:hypothetical protein RF11_14099 [Thelohanellus kitauei]|uniref:ISXO2-like transposase domain-containing protein n=1 Tax=Thelohanellus kitauei TaxID=669202 RepID=A0A0C2IUT5_THEKT|nr:hypothetical protein RF11_14099 [Thelohanellus kitauei]
MVYSIYSLSRENLNNKKNTQEFLLCWHLLPSSLNCRGGKKTNEKNETIDINCFFNRFGNATIETALVQCETSVLHESTNTDHCRVLHIQYGIVLSGGGFKEWKNRGNWLVGPLRDMVETKERFLIPVPKRDRETLQPIICDNVLPGIKSKLIEDYNFLNINHSINFVDPHYGANTQNIESTWWKIKRNLPQTHTRKTVFIYILENISGGKWYIDLVVMYLSISSNASPICFNFQL